MNYYNLLYTSPLLGITYLALLFLLCLIFVVGVKTVYNAIIVKPKPKRTPKKQRPSISKPIKSIEINPDEIDKIYVKRQ